MPQKSTAERAVLTDAAGAGVLDYLLPLPGTPRYAADARPLVPGAARTVLDRMRGWRITTRAEFGGELIAMGAEPQRTSRKMRRNLVDDPPPAAWAGLAPDRPGLRVTAFDQGIDRLFPAIQEAFPPGHPDSRSVLDPGADRAALSALLSGRALGPVQDLSSLVVDDGRNADDPVAAGLVVNDRAAGVLWIGEVFRRPDDRYRGLGGLLLRRMLAAAAGAGAPEVGLAVTVGNDAEHLYTRLGFRDLGVFTTVRIPGEPERAG
ncbi:GNAT superfamily N-acetyltransferase [Nocardiopsis mwathae]|uniref:GNAT superfamily N-acetyltransferase n=1 Tax=Nocardiopsis mwathae TaxID=1472723 RepID=A0A7W9YHM7_9ACTN|nr:GNAT family N-acetyltransferase [Nocardiopsis mwathae]MBB6172297.1 GNAT superfamily N-acetyltransferase [Nocardiopsis mwathae]